jgi:predicted ferric reductase
MDCKNRQGGWVAEAGASESPLIDRASAATAPWRSPWIARKTWGTLLCAAYPVLALTPLMVFAATSPPSDDATPVRVAVNCAVVAFSIIAMQFVLMGRFRWIEAPFGLDVILRFHQGMALVSICLLCAHPLLLGSALSWKLLTRWSVRWPIWAGRLALLVLLTHGAAAVGRRALRLRYETWLRTHNVGALLLLGLGFAHSLAVGGDFAAPGPQRIIWIALLLTACGAWLYRRAVRPRALAKRPYKVLSVHREAPAVWTVTLQPATDNQSPFVPGQFYFLRPIGGSLPAEEHPFSVASSPRSDGKISFTIKQCGDFTSAVGGLTAGDLVAVHGPFGRFSHVFHAGSDDLVFVAAGVGITPLISMLRYMRDRRDPRRVLLVYANRDPAAILFRQELENLESTGLPLLRVVHVVSHAADDGHMVEGRLDAPLLQRICGDLSGKRFFVCCPPQMSASLTCGLRRAGVALSRIHNDFFGF